EPSAHDRPDSGSACRMQMNRAGRLFRRDRRGTEINSLITASGRICPTAAFTAAASSASAMTGSAPISFNAAAESRDWVSANPSCWFALRRGPSARPIAPLAPATRILIAFPFPLALRRPASRSLVVDRGLRAVIGDDVGDQPRRLG